MIDSPSVHLNGHYPDLAEKITHDALYLIASNRKVSAMNNHPRRTFTAPDINYKGNFLQNMTSDNTL